MWSSSSILNNCSFNYVTWWPNQISHKCITESRAIIFFREFVSGVEFFNNYKIIEIMQRYYIESTFIMDIFYISINLIKMPYIYIEESYNFWKQGWTEMTTFRPNGWFIDLLCLLWR